ncbi:MAG: hypothetical protein HZB83_04725, partial [Deltaproteobacteria bacterium]|nr:hypothetical protein [Deltaproteobacteria bacterium]
MDRTLFIRRITLISLLFLLFAAITLPRPAFSGGGQIASGPYSLTIRGGAQSDSGSLGFDGRADYLNPVLNVHLFGTYDLLDDSGGIGEIMKQRYGAGLALSHTHPGKANVFLGAAFINELGENFSHVYAGGKLKVADNALITGSYGIGLGDMKDIKQIQGALAAKSTSWGKLGVVLIAQTGLKANINYYLTDPGDLNISGVEGELSYPVTESTTIGINGSSDLTTKTDVDKNWKSNLFVTYAFGGQKGSPIDVALDKNSPVVWPAILRTSKATTAASTLAISPTATTNAGCSAPASTFTASGGTGP